MIIALAPERVGHVQVDLIALLDFVESFPQPAKGAVHRLLREGEMQHALHFLFGLSPRPRPGHRQGRGNAVRRKEQIVALTLLALIQVNGAGGVAFDDCCD